MRLAFDEPGTISNSKLHKVIRGLLYRSDHNAASGSTLRNIVLVPYGFFDIKFLEQVGLDPESINHRQCVLDTPLLDVRLIPTNKKFAARLEDDLITIDQTRDSFATRRAKFSWS
jgi:hypothetical protein